MNARLANGTRHHLSSEWQITSRKDIDSLNNGISQPLENKEDLQLLNELVERSIDLTSSSYSSLHFSSKGPVEKTAAQNAVEFCLLSSMGVTKIALQPENTSQRQREADEDSPAELALRRERARAAALDWSSIIEQGRIPYLPRTKSTNNVIKYQSGSDPNGTSPTLLVTERDIRVDSRPDLLRDALRLKICPTVPVKRLSAERTGNVKGRKKVKVEAHFFRPKPEWSGKSRGYAMGYEGSWAAP